MPVGLKKMSKEFENRMKGIVLRSTLAGLLVGGTFFSGFLTGYYVGTHKKDILQLTQDIPVEQKLLEKRQPRYSIMVHDFNKFYDINCDGWISEGESKRVEKWIRNEDLWEPYE